MPNDPDTDSYYDGGNESDGDELDAQEEAEEMAGAFMDQRIDEARNEVFDGDS